MIGHFIFPNKLLNLFDKTTNVQETEQQIT